MDALAILGAIDNWFGKIANNMVYQDQKQFSIDMAEQSHQWDMETMDKAHEMNSPVEKKRQLSEAGIHPSVMLQGDSFANVSQPSAPMAAVPQPPTIDGMLSSLLLAEDLKAKKIENENQPKLNAKQLSLLDGQIASLVAKNKLDSQQWEILEASKQFTVGKNAAELDEVLQRVHLLQEQGKKTKQETSNLETQGEILEKELSFEEFKEEFRKLTGVAYSDDQIVQCYGLLRAGKLSEVFETLVTAAKSSLDILFGKDGAKGVGYLLDLGNPLQKVKQLFQELGVLVGD